MELYFIEHNLMGKHMHDGGKFVNIFSYISMQLSILVWECRLYKSDDSSLLEIVRT